MSAQEVWCMVAVIAAAAAVLASTALALRAPTDRTAVGAHARTALLAAAVGALGAALWIAL